MSIIDLPTQHAAKAGVTDGVAVVCFRFVDHSARWQYDVHKVKSQWSHLGKIKSACELWALTSPVQVVSSSLFTSIPPGKCLNLSGLSDVRVTLSASRSCGELETLSAIPEDAQKPQRNRAWSVNDGQVFSKSVFSRHPRAPNSRAYSRLHEYDNKTPDFQKYKLL